MKKEVQGRWGRVATRCAAIAERDEVSRREDDIIMHKGYDLAILFENGARELGAPAVMHQQLGIEDDALTGGQDFLQSSVQQECFRTDRLSAR